MMSMFNRKKKSVHYYKRRNIFERNAVREIQVHVQYSAVQYKSQRMPPRDRISLQQRERIVRAFEDVHEDYLAIAETIGVNRSTARGIVSRYVREGRIAERPRGGANHVRVDDAIRDFLHEIIDENCLLTIAEMNRESRLRLPHKPTIHDRTVARSLEGRLYRVKLVRPLPADRNRPNVLQKRVEYENWFMGHAVVNHTVFIHECGNNIWIARSQGRALRGERAYREVCGQRGRNVTVALAVSPLVVQCFTQQYSEA
ncbi:hypothetical protein AWC38_SpisGene17218 [Stylophora pistillata]|uniref:Paired domain-containing protein n=1 Tax=Stylophora pistillata TaxID=50429 RepID=A0A2B4RJ46_STYPI|nr:hypothetical protein AWC38_SpisGene17218 [Stylophora pistillata]